MEINIKFKENWLSTFSLLLYLIALFTYQKSGGIQTLIRYGTLFFVIIAYFFDHPPFRTEKERGTFHLTENSMWLFLLLIFLASTSIWCLEFANVKGTVFNIFKVALVCIIVEPHLKSREDIEQVIKLLLLALIYMVLVYMIKTPVTQWGGVRAGAVVGVSPNDWARNCNLGSIVALYFFFTAKKNRIVYFSLVLFFCAFALLSGSKNAILIMVFQMGLFIYLKTKKGFRFLVIVGTFLLLTLLIYLVTELPFFYNLLGRRIVDMMVELGLISGTANQYGSTRERIFFIKTAWEVFKTHPLLGVGCNNFSSYLKSIHYSNPKYSHSGFVELLSTTGIVGFLIYYVRYLYVIVCLKKKAFSHDSLYILLFVVLLRIFIFDISTISMYTYNNFIILMFASALLFSTNQKKENIQ